ncbi:homologous recombination OB-fold protein-like isoform X2 [Pimephales promelas]|uniref:homologous recombination OB-fold protein-like isoform X2 n=1 Tax=Pimephales promelas TaxID=90988 RepID=UPI0019558253|nr:homologous recombination OB-fold protein-like isoform X2 [Pimephales promelas]KAG1964448.1 homologous recombination OB-fold protein [Pimephales promelas]
MIDGTDMTASASVKWKGLFSLGEEFDDEDLLEPDWTCPSERTSSTAPSVTPPSESSHVLAEKSTHVQQRPVSLSSDPGENTSGSGCVATLRTPTCGTINSPPDFSVPCHQTLLSLRAPASSLKPSSNQVNHPPPASLSVPQRDPTPQDDFDDWDVDLEELDSIPQVVSEPQNISSPLDNISPIKRMRHSAPEVSSHGRFSGTCSVSVARPSINSSIASNVEAPRCPSTPMQNPNHMRIPTTLVSRLPRPVTTRPPVVSPRCHMGTSSPRTPLQPRGSLFHSASSAIDSSSTLTPRPLNTPVLTNHLVQLVSAANKTPQRPQSCMMITKARRFPGPAGALPQQVSQAVSGGSLDDIVVSVPHTPAHGAVARLRNEQVSSSQVSEEEEFSRGPWAVMKSEMGLDEKNPSCFLHLYSVVMVLRKAALRQLTKNKVPNMAVVLKSITHTHVDAKAIFRDPTGEMQGTVHRRLVEDRLGELKTGAVLLLKQVGVFSPSHRNHYLNVTPNNLLRIYPPDGVFHDSQPSHPPLELRSEPSKPTGGPVSQMVLHFDDEDENTVEENRAADALDTAAGSNELCQASTVLGPTEETAWETDDLDELLGELPVESYDGLR